MKTFLVLIPCAALVYYLGSEIGSDEYFVPVLSVIAVVGLCVLKLLTNYARLEAVFIGFLLAGYFVGNRGFADLAVVKPLYVGELSIVVIILTLISRRILAREQIRIEGVLPKLVILYIAYAVLRWSFDVKEYGLDSVRDLAIVYYAIFFFFACQISSGVQERKFIERCLLIAFLGQGAVAHAVYFFPQWFEVTGEVSSILAQKGDLIATFSAVGIFFIYTHKKSYVFVWTRPLMLVLLFLSIALSVARSGIVALVVTSGLMLIAGAKRYFIYPIAVVGTGLMVLFLSSALLDDKDQNSHIVDAKEKLLSAVDIYGRYEYKSDLGDMKAGNNEFRRMFWKSVIEETTADNPIFGKGFGYDFLPRFEQTYAAGSWDGLRSPHSYFVSVYGRMGIVGSLIFWTIAAYILQQGIAAAIMVRRGMMPLTIMGYWCSVWVLMISSAVGVVLEGPMGGIPFWTLLGLSFSYSKAYAEEAAAARRLQRGLSLNPRIACSPLAEDDVHSPGRNAPLGLARASSFSTGR